MSVVSNSNHWMFISSNGGLTAGRKNPQFALFPYYTDDKLTELAHTTGSKTIFQAQKDGKTWIWEPFSDRFSNLYAVTRNLYKVVYGNKILFEEINHDLGLTFRYQWNSSNLFGFVKKSELVNSTGESISLKVIDGMQNIMPHGVSADLQAASSNLVDAYKRSELVSETGLGLYALSAIIVDKAEPSEALKSNIAWSMGLKPDFHLLSSLQLEAFRQQKAIHAETDVKGEKGAYFVHSTFVLDAYQEKNWLFAANVNQTHAAIIALNERLKTEADSLKTDLLDDIQLGTEQLIQLVAAADGLQCSADELKNARHFSNVLFNIMRGGIFDENYTIEKADFSTYLKKANNEVFARNQEFIHAFADKFSLTDLQKALNTSSDHDFVRLAKEYLPLKFSRRHGDPSRPWNKFSINTHSEVDGSKILDYEGNWRDIFQNWEALAYSYPEFVEGMISKFLNASTFDGYNPYRVTKGGFDWETIEPDNPWSYIGYWGDHQIIYLLKFLEFYQKIEPTAFDSLFDRDFFVYAHVPYRIKSYADITKDPKNTIEFDEHADREIRKQIERKGADGALLTNPNGDIHRVNFIEKILATVLSKVSNFVPEGGIWMNTQRPEWNDANNALVGNGVSMVTLYYLRRFLAFFEQVTAQSTVQEIELSEEIAGFFDRLQATLNEHKNVLHSTISDQTRKTITDALGQAGSDFRNQVYAHGFSGKKRTVSLKDIHDFSVLTRSYLEQSITANRRSDSLYHAYNLLSYSAEGIRIEQLSEMLEGQVAVLSSQFLKPKEAVGVLQALRKSALYREDQNSYILYPNKALPGFLEKNSIPESLINQSALLKKLLSDGNTSIVQIDVLGGYHFNGNFKNARDLQEALDTLKHSHYAELVLADESLVLQIFEEIFNHKAFTGRSGTFYGYEGLGSIYWHMVSKLYLAVEEVCSASHEGNYAPKTFAELAHFFDEVGNGIGVHKNPELYGAFPTDPYSHTPYHRGAQQPGMTGQVKEDILVRLGELGVSIKDGCLQFNPGLLKKDEFLTKETIFEYVDINQVKQQLLMPARALGFTFCQVPVVYQIGDKTKLEAVLNDGTVKAFDQAKLDKTLSHEVFNRTGLVDLLTITLTENQLR